jgi:small subunit ribosomal protein S1
MVHVSQLSRDRVDNPRDQFQPGNLVEAEILQVDTRERRIGLSVRSLLDSKDKAEMRQYMATETKSSKTTLGDLINQELVRGKGDESDAGEKGESGE